MPNSLWTVDSCIVVMAACKFFCHHEHRHLEVLSTNLNVKRQVFLDISGDTNERWNLDEKILGKFVLNFLT